MRNNNVGIIYDVLNGETDMIDEGILDIIIKLNQKNYKTIYCCEGHTNENGWEGYIGFLTDYKINPPNYYSKRDRNGCFYYWNGKSEEERQEWLVELKKWVDELKPRDLVIIKNYSLYTNNGKSKIGRLIKKSNLIKEIKKLSEEYKNKGYEVRIEENELCRY